MVYYLQTRTHNDHIVYNCGESSAVNAVPRSNASGYTVLTVFIGSSIVFSVTITNTTVCTQFSAFNFYNVFASDRTCLIFAFYPTRSGYVQLSPLGFSFLHSFSYCKHERWVFVFMFIDLCLHRMASSQFGMV